MQICGREHHQLQRTQHPKPDAIPGVADRARKHLTLLHTSRYNCIPRQLLRGWNRRQEVHEF